MAHAPHMIVLLKVGESLFRSYEIVIKRGALACLLINIHAWNCTKRRQKDLNKEKKYIIQNWQSRLLHSDVMYCSRIDLCAKLT